MKSSNDCATCEPLKNAGFKNRASIIRRELRRHHLSERERHLAEVILEMTLGWGRDSIVIPQLQCFTDLTGIGKTHVSEGIQDLHNMRIIRLITVKGQPTYSIREDTDNWKVKPRVSTQAMINSINLVRDWNSLPPLESPLEAIANFKVRPKTGKINSNVPESGTPAGLPVIMELPHLF